MSSCLRGGGRPCGLDLDIRKKPSPSSLSSSLCGRSSSQTSSWSSTLSESSNSSPCRISIKRARAPRKRPNQTYNEAAALLSSIYPNIFPTESPKWSSTKTDRFYSFDESPDLLLSTVPVLGDDPYLIGEQTEERPRFLFEVKAASPVESLGMSQTSSEFKEPSSPSPLDEDFTTESILDVEVGEGIDSIMVSHRTDSDTGEEMKSSYTSCPFLQGLNGIQLGTELELGLGFICRKNLLHTALRQRDSSDWWRNPVVPVDEIAPKLKQPSLDKKKKKTKKLKDIKEVAVRDKQNNVSTRPTVAGPAATMAGITATIKNSLRQKIKATGLGLKLNHEEVIKAWSGKGWIFSDGPDFPDSSAEALAKLAEIELFVDGSGVGGAREASVLRYKEKRRTRLFSKKIRYQVRKVSADTRPRTKASGKFVKKADTVTVKDEES